MIDNPTDYLHTYAPARKRARAQEWRRFMRFARRGAGGRVRFDGTEGKKPNNGGSLHRCELHKFEGGERY